MRTYGATLRAIVLKVALKLGTQALPMVSAAQFFSVSGSAVLSGPKSPSTVSAQPGVRRSYVELGKLRLRTAMSSGVSALFLIVTGLCS